MCLIRNDTNDVICNIIVEDRLITLLKQLYVVIIIHIFLNHMIVRKKPLVVLMRVQYVINLTFIVDFAMQ